VNGPRNVRYASYPGYDVLAKRDSPSWDGVTRRVIDARCAVEESSRFLGPAQFRALVALCDCLIPQPLDDDTCVAQDADGPVRVPIAALVDGKLLANHGDGFRDSRLPPLREAWAIGLAALDAESERAGRAPFAELDAQAQRALIERMQRGELHARAWQGMPCEVFFAKRALHDICAAFYSHPASWSAIGFGGPANPRGYVRLVADRRDPWEAVEVVRKDTAAPTHAAENENAARRKNRHVR